MHHNLLFDLDQTLLDFHASEHIALKIIMERNHLVFKEEYYHFFKQSTNHFGLSLKKVIFQKMSYLREDSNDCLRNADVIQTR